MPGQLAPELRELGERRQARAEHDRVHQPPLEHASERRGRAAGDDAGTVLGQRAAEREQRGAALEQRGDRGHRQPGAWRSVAGRDRPAPMATSVRTISPARLSTPRALS